MRREVRPLLVAVPHGDPVHAAESGCVEDEVEALSPWDDDVVRELVLDDDVGHVTRWRDRSCQRVPALRSCTEARVSIGLLPVEAPLRPLRGRLVPGLDAGL